MKKHSVSRRGVGLVVGLVWCLLVSVGCDREGGSNSETTEPPGEEAQSSVESPEGPEAAPRDLFSRRHDMAGEVIDWVVEAVKEGYDEETFPGGTGVEWRSSDRLPVEGEQLELEGVAGDAGSTEGSRFERLGLQAGTKLPVLLIYQTGDEPGEHATARVKAVADFQPDVPANHTIEQELSIDVKTGKVNVFPRLVHHRWK